MKRMDFQTQLTVGLLTVIAGFLCAHIFHQGIFTNLGWAVYGLLFVLNPVYPPEVKTPPIKMRKYIRITGAFIFTFSMLTKFRV